MDKQSQKITVLLPVYTVIAVIGMYGRQEGRVWALLICVSCGECVFCNGADKTGQKAELLRIGKEL